MRDAFVESPVTGQPAILVATAAQAGSVARTTAAAASLIAKAAAGVLHEVRVTNGASAQYFQVHDSATLPADTAVPKESFYVPANTTGFLSVRSEAYTNGIVVCNSSTLATKTIGSADSWIVVEYD